MTDPRDSLFLRACRGEEVDRVPVWFMRQAGRSLPEYRKVREQHEILEICRTPELATEVTLQPVTRLGVDAAILFSDIVVVLLEMGVDLEIVPGRGPVLAEPVRDAAAVAALSPLPPDGIDYVNKAVSAIAGEANVPLIGFAGGPFTLACYLIEGGPSRDHARTKALMWSEPELWDRLMAVLSDSVITCLRGQITSGAAAIQLFDSWIGTLSPNAMRERVAPWVTSIFDVLGSEVPRIYFGVGTGEILADMADCGPDIVGIDWRVPLDVARERVGGKPVQGNLDPALLLGEWGPVEKEVDRILEEGGGRGHIFNLGHGVLPDTDPGVLKRVVDHIGNRGS